MSFKLENDVDFAWVTADFGSGPEGYKITHYTIPFILQLLKKHGHRKKGKKYAKNEYDLTDAASLDLRKEAICFVLLDWKDGVILDKDGKNVKCGENEKIQLVLDSQTRIEWILSKAILPSIFHPNEEQEAKNSERPLNTENGVSATKSNSRIAESVLK